MAEYKEKKRRTLQMQITMVVAAVLLLVGIILTVNSIYSANNYYGNIDAFAGPDAIVTQNKDSNKSKTQINEEQMMEDEVTLADRLRSFSIQGIVVMLGVILAAVAFTYWITGKMMRPLYELTDSIRYMDESRLSRQVQIKAPTEEVYQLTVSYNHMLRRLEESFEAERRFASNAAHELKTPLAIMKTSVQVLTMDDTPSVEDYEEFTQDVKASVERLIKTVDGLLLLADRQEWGGKETIDLKEMQKEIALHLAERAKQNKVRIQVEGTKSEAVGNKVLFYRIFYNIIENAVKYSRPGGTVFIETGIVEGRPSVKVSDQGIGMKEETIRNIFEPFYREDKSRSQKIDGAGIGMSIVKMMLDKVEGTIDIDSVPGEGTTVQVVLKGDFSVNLDTKRKGGV